MAIEVRSINGFVAEIAGIDLEQDLDDTTAGTIRDIWVKHGVVVFPGGGTSPDAHLRVSQCFGQLQ
ncbi:TauD/TfdA family dioxygenase, partial [Acinetobacter baumannii]